MILLPLGSWAQEIDQLRQKYKQAENYEAKLEGQRRLAIAFQKAHQADSSAAYLAGYRALAESQKDTIALNRHHYLSANFAYHAGDVLRAVELLNQA
ncbi:MAG: hypothetical protein AAF399_16565, partial [Bacteroidota bacterium]